MQWVWMLAHCGQIPQCARLEDNFERLNTLPQPCTLWMWERILHAPEGLLLAGPIDVSAPAYPDVSPVH